MSAWPLVPLRRAVKIINGGTPTPDEHNWGGSVPWATPVDLATVDGGQLSATERLLTEEGLKKGSRTVPAGSLIISTRAPIGYVARVDRVTAFNQGCRGLVPQEACDGRFLQYALISQTDVLQSLGTGSTFLELSTEALANVTVPLPPVEEQRRIANYLDDQTTRIDQAIQLRLREMVLVEERRRILLSDLYFGTDQPLGRLKQIAYVTHGRQRSPEHEKGNFMTPYVRSANVSDGAINTDDVKEMNFNPQERVRYGLRRGDVLVTEAAGSVEAIGASAQWTAEWRGPICFQNHLLRVRARDGLVTPDYLHWWARAAWASGAMRVWATGANILNLGSESLRNAPIPVRSLSEQNLLANRCNELDDWATSAGNSLEASVALLTDRRRSLITAAISGEMDALSAAEVRDLRGR